MKFKYSAIGKNTPENRKWLEKLGYYIPKIASKWDLLFTTSTGNVASLSNKNKGFLERDDSFIDCRNNPDLFKAVTAIREDSDYMQWFVIDEYMQFGIGGNVVGLEPRKRLVKSGYYVIMMI